MTVLGRLLEEKLGFDLISRDIKQAALMNRPQLILCQ
jgi:hypothetical protein